MTRSLERAVNPGAIGDMRSSAGAAAPSSDRFLRLRAACCRESVIDLDEHALLVMRVLARLEERRNG